VPKIQEISSTELIFCSLKTTLKIEIDKKIRILNCTTSLIEEVNQELFKRFYKPIYIPLIAIICSFLIILPKSSRNYKSQSRLIFLFGFLILIFSETTLRYSTNSNLFMAMYIILPWIFFLIIYTIFYMKVKNV